MASIEGVEVNIELEERTDPNEINDKSQTRSATVTAATLSPQLHVQNDQPDTLQPKPDLLRSYSSVEGSQRRTISYVKQVPSDDDICFLEDVDICLVIPPKLRHLDYPRVEDSHDEDVAKVIRKKFSKLGIDESSKDILTFLSSDHQHSSYVSWQARIEEAAEEEENDIFWQNVSKKTNDMNIGKMEAVFEVYTDLLVERADGFVDQALLWILRQDIKEFCAEVFVIRLLQRNARVTTAGADRNTPLHLAAMKGFTNVAKKLIDNGAYVAAENIAGHNPLYLAVEKNHCDFAVLVVHNMEPARVRQMFQGQGTQESKLSLHSLLLKKETMNELVLAVLDTMMEPLESEHNTYVVYYNILDGDRQGRPPNDSKFDKSHKSCLHKIAKSNNKASV